MARAYSLDLRERVVAAVATGESCRSVAAKFKVSVASLWLALANLPRLTVGGLSLCRFALHTETRLAPVPMHRLQSAYRFCPSLCSPPLRQKEVQCVGPHAFTSR
jgi:hypothetical protein